MALMLTVVPSSREPFDTARPTTETVLSKKRHLVEM